MSWWIEFLMQPRNPSAYSPKTRSSLSSVLPWRRENPRQIDPLTFARILHRYAERPPGARNSRTNLVKLTSSCSIVLVMATLSARAADESIEKLAQDPTCAKAFEWIDKNAAWVTDQQIRLTEIPAPESKEARRGDALRKLFEANEIGRAHV